MERKNHTHWQPSLAVTIALIAMIAAASLWVTDRVNQMEEARSFARLQEEAAGLAKDIESRVRSDREQLEMIATVVSEYQDLTSPRLWEVLDSYAASGVMSRLELLLPDDTVLTTGGVRLEADGLPSFAAESLQGAHITDRSADPNSEGEYIARHYVPVLREGETVAMLYGVVELGTLPEELVAEPYGGEAAIYIIDGDTGDFLVDTWHNEPGGNIWSLGERPMADGYNHEQLKQGLIDGETGYVVFVSRSIGRYLYFYYQPLAVNQWRLALSVPEDVVFESADTIRTLLDLFLFFEIVCFALYFLWMLRYVRRETSQKQRQLDLINYVYDVESLLFNAHEKQENLSAALERIARITSASSVGFWSAEALGGGASFLWQRGASPAVQGLDRAMDMLAARLMEYFRAGGVAVAVSGPEELRTLLHSGEPMLDTSLIAVPITDRAGGLCGVLFACGVPQKWVDPSPLRHVGISFSMFEQNRRIYNAVKRRGERDALSGLYNRNRFEVDVPEYASRYRTSLACVYIDINGLHELNNQEGHEAGDNMIRSTAQALIEVFGTDCAYRIGGDEFVAFVTDRDEGAVRQMCRSVEETLAAKEIHVSVGMGWREQVSSVDELIKEAEQAMYAAKRAYYGQAAHDRRRDGVRHAPTVS